MAEPELSRRDLIHLVGKAGGVAAAYHTMAAMGLLAVPSAYAGPPALPPGRGRRVVIIGAGIAGMVLAYELRKVRLPAADPGGADAPRRPQLVAARRRHGYRDRQHAARRLGSRRASVFQSGTGAAALPPRGHPVVLPHARRAARGDVQRQSRRADAGRPCLRWRAATQSPGGERRARLRRGTGGEGGGQGPAGAAGQRGGQGTAARVPARLRRAGQGPCLSRLVPRRLVAAAGCDAAGHAESAVGSAADPGIGFLARTDAVRRTLHHGGDHAATGRRHGPHRPGVRRARCPASSPTRRW